MRTIQVKVKPNAKVSSLQELDDGSWIAQIKAPPVDGKANQELVALIATYFDCPKSCVLIKTGATGRLKRIQIDLD